MTRRPACGYPPLEGLGEVGERPGRPEISIRSEPQLTERHCIFYAGIAAYVYDFHADERVGGFPVNAEQAEVIFHHRPLNAVGVGGGEMPGGGDAAGGDVVDGVGAGGLYFGDFGVVYVAADEEDALGAGFLDEVHHALLFVREIGPGFVAIEFDAKLRAGADDAQIGGAAQFGFEPAPLLFAEEGGIGGLVGEVVERVEVAALVVQFAAVVAEVVAKSAGIEEDDLEFFAAIMI